MSNKNNKKNELLDRFLGTIFSLSVFDAFSFSYENIFTSKFLKEINIDTNFYPQNSEHKQGFYTQNTELTLAVIRSILKDNDIKENTIIEEFKNYFDNEMIIGKTYKTKNFIDKIIIGKNLKEAKASIGNTDYTTLPRSVPVGLFYFDKKIKVLIEKAKELSEITHLDYRNTASSIAIASAIALLLTQKKQIDIEKFLTIIANNVTNFEENVAEYIYSIKFLLKKDISISELKLKKAGNDNYSPYEYGGGLSEFCVSQLLIAFYHFLLNQNDFKGLLSSIIKVGGIISPAASIAGALWGALNGYDKMPAPLVNFLNNKEKIYEIVINFYKLKFNK